MPFALIPEGFELRKVTKLQQAAVDKYYSDKNTEAFLEGDAPAQLVKTVAVVVTPIVLAVLAKRGFEFAEEEVKDIVTATSEAAGAIVSEDTIVKLVKFVIELGGPVPFTFFKDD
jgi:hypothetical protein